MELIAGAAYRTKGWIEHVELNEVNSAMKDRRTGQRTKPPVDIPEVSP